jgi:hypothetical protein
MDNNGPNITEKEHVYGQTQEIANIIVSKTNNRVMWSFVFVIFLGGVNGLIAISGLIKLMVGLMGGSGYKAAMLLKTKVSHSILMYVPMLIASAIYMIIAIGPINQARKVTIYTGVVIIGTCLFILWMISIFGADSIEDLFVFCHIVESVPMPLLFSLMAFYDRSQLAAKIMPYPSTD